MTLARVLRGGVDGMSFAGVLVFLPLSFDICGKQALLALSVLLILYYSLFVTLHLLTRNRSGWVSKLISISSVAAQPAVVMGSLLLVLNLYSDEAKTVNAGGTFVVALSRAAQLWETVLIASSPVFVLAEGLASLVSIQAISRFSSRRIARSRTPDLLQLCFLVLSALIYVTSAYFLYAAYQSDLDNQFLLGVAITEVLFLTIISFSLQKGNLIETSLVFAYTVLQVYHLNTKLRPNEQSLLQIIFASKNTHPPLPPLLLKSWATVSRLASVLFGAGIDFATAALSALPVAVLVGLFYRVAVLYFASRIILSLKHRNEGHSHKKLSEEDAASRLITVLVAYSRLSLISVYTHLLLISASGHDSLWRWVNVLSTITLWGIELKIGEVGEARWKTE